MLSFGIDWARAAITAARRREFASGSGRPIFAATVISRLSLEKRAERFLSCAPFRYMMFLNLLWPAIDYLFVPRRRPGSSLFSIERFAPWAPASAGEQFCSGQSQRLAIGLHQRVGLLAGVGLHLPETNDRPHRPGVIAVRLGLGIDVANIVRDALLLLLQA